MPALHQSQEEACTREALVVQQLQARSLRLLPEQLARVDDTCPATVSREDLIEFMASPPSDFWGGYAMACYVMRTQLAAVTGREFF